VEDEDDPFGRVEYNGEESDDQNPEKPNGLQRDDAEDDGSEYESNIKGEKDGIADARFDPEDDISAEATGDSDSDEGSTASQPQDDGVDRTELRKIMAEEQKSVAATISQAAKADVDKGKAVKKQRKTFDTLLNTRINLQKALVATNSITAVDDTAERHMNAGDAISAAEAAAMTLWNNLNSLRSNFDAARTGQKRKQDSLDNNAQSTSIWTEMQLHESSNLPNRRIVLDKWSTKARGVSALPRSGRLNNNAHQQTITDVLNLQLADPSRLIKRTQMPRSCAPVQAKSATSVENPNIYDDADFYGLLLKELLEQKGQDAAVAGADFASQSQWQAAREAKTKKNVDTKASKGRKLRYTVHEKLQNFMAPEDRTTWTQRQTDELFSSLFGKGMGLREEVEEREPESRGEEEAEGGGLMLFRS